MKDYGLDIRVNTGRLQPTTGRLQPTTGRLQYGQGVFRDSWTYERLRYGQDVLRAACTHGRLQHDYRTTGQLQHDYSTATGRLQDDHYRLQDDDSTVERVRGRLATSDDYVNTARSGRASSLPGPTDDYHTASWTPDDYGTAGRASARPATATQSAGPRTTTARSGRALSPPDDYRTVNWNPGRLRHGQGVL